MSKRKQRSYPAMVKRRMIEEDLCSDLMFNFYLSIIVVAAVTGFVYLHLCILKTV